MGDLQILKTGLLKFRPDDPERFPLKIRTQVGRRRLSERDQKVNGRALQIGCGRRRVLSQNIVGLALRPIERRHITNGEPALDGGDACRAQALSDNIGDRHLLRSQADQHVNVLKRLHAGSGRGHLRNDAARRHFRAVEFVFDSQFQTKPGDNPLRLRDGHTD